ncbi:RagB/SusD family nutrient uptake outer membrane protein [Parapedobacter koreensis]|uniref:Starch-binding associating with outer membrane n=1 Tax=Parapedobacter koreensis TaxID=332977 RepID=A0A1H7FP23_9SPHI|nr:RagB/SusD family nutrient uptake outer membrane protein [Parapedobacter koreensis]SEK27843.1 Starch-binding associating with outer membrane [Parapedobacter koreensis]
MHVFNWIIKKATFAFALLSLVACEDFLTQSDPSNFTSQNYYTKPEHAQSAVDAIYVDLRQIRGGSNSGAAWLMTEFASGLGNTTALGSAQNNLTFRNLEFDPNNPYGASYWNSHYRGIANANIAIQKIPDITMDEGLKNRLLGEARFLRAYYYYNLVRLFGEVPLILEPVDLGSDNFMPLRAPINDVYQLIVSDLQTAETAGLPYTSIAGRVSLGAVQSLLADVYLTMAGYPLNLGTAYYTLARDKAKEVVDANMHHLFQSYDSLRMEGSENQGEHIFMTQFDQNVANHNGLQLILIPFNAPISNIEGYGMLYPVIEFVESYEDGDRRAEEKQFFYTSYGAASDRSQIIEFGAPYIYKWFDDNANVSGNISGLNWPLIRFAEVLLTYAEAENEVSGPTALAYQALNQIRKRANLADLSGLSTEDFREAVWRERWHELCYENKTWFDMARLRKVYNLRTGRFDEFVGHQFVYGPTLSSRELLFPIPESEILNNKNLTQNEGY